MKQAIKPDLHKSLTSNNGLNDAFYSKKFYEEQFKGSFRSAKIVLPIVLKFLPEINSAVDFGCGTGIWLSVLKNLGVNEIKGYDGSWAEKKLVIPSECYTDVEFDKETIKVEKKYDLAMSLEVAEHLPKQNAKMFVETITNASDIVLFSAAIPFQGGTHHINEQWQSYWYDIFYEYGYIGTNFLRKKILKEKKVAIWYRQNIVLYVKKEKLGAISISEECFNNKQIDFMFSENCLNIMGKFNVSLLSLCKSAVKRTIKKILRLAKKQRS